MATLAFNAFGMTAVPVVAQGLVPNQVSRNNSSDLTPAERDTLVGKLKKAQLQLGSGEKLSFELVSGGPAFYDVTTMPPRRAFVDMAFANPYSAKRYDGPGLSQQYELIYFPPGANGLMWKVTVFVGRFEPQALERVEMINTAQPPF